MRGHKMAEMLGAIANESTADQYQDRPASVLFCFGHCVLCRVF